MVLQGCGQGVKLSSCILELRRSGITILLGFVLNNGNTQSFIFGTKITFSTILFECLLCILKSSIQQSGLLNTHGVRHVLHAWVSQQYFVETTNRPAQHVIT